MSNVIQYRATGGVDYTFRFAWISQQQSWRVYIERQPSYGSLNASAHASHRLGLPHHPYVCWTTPLRTYADACSVAALWADATQRYIATGYFEPAPGQRKVQDRSTFAGVAENQLRATLAEGGRSNRTSTPQLQPAGRSGPIRRLLERIG